MELHSLRTESNLSPYPLWISGVIEDRLSTYMGVRDILEVTELYGVEVCGHECSLDDDIVEVTVPEINIPLTSEEKIL